MYCAISVTKGAEPERSRRKWTEEDMNRSSTAEPSSSHPHPRPVPPHFLRERASSTKLAPDVFSRGFTTIVQDVLLHYIQGGRQKPVKKYQRFSIQWDVEQSQGSVYVFPLWMCLDKLQNKDKIGGEGTLIKGAVKGAYLKLGKNPPLHSATHRRETPGKGFHYSFSPLHLPSAGIMYLSPYIISYFEVCYSPPLHPFLRLTIPRRPLCTVFSWIL